MHNFLPEKEKYLSQARSILYNLNDPKNSSFRDKLKAGHYALEQVPLLTAEEMCSYWKMSSRDPRNAD